MKITAIETIQVDEIPFLIFVRVHTDEGLIGTSDTYYTTSAIRAAIHDWAAPMLLGKDPRQIERHWDSLYAKSAARWGGTGVEMRAISAIDVALWDILGQSLGAPIWQLLGGLAHDRVPTYNTCGGPMYGRNQNRGGDGRGPLEDLWAQLNEPEVLAQELLAEGIRAMKIWPFDRFALRGTGRHITAAELSRGARALQADPRGGRRPHRDHARGPRLLGPHDGEADRRRGRGVPARVAGGHGARPRRRPARD